MLLTWVCSRHVVALGVCGHWRSSRLGARLSMGWLRKCRSRRQQRVVIAALHHSCVTYVFVALCRAGVTAAVDTDGSAEVGFDRACAYQGCDFTRLRCADATRVPRRHRHVSHYRGCVCRSRVGNWKALGGWLRRTAAASGRVGGDL